MRLKLFQSKRFLILALLADLFALSLPTLAQSQRTVVLTNQQGKYAIGLHLEILEDNDKQWTIEDVASPELAQQFVPSEEETPGFGFTNSAIWVRFLVGNEADQVIPWLLAVESNLFYIDVYMPAANAEGYEVIQTGTARPYDTRMVDHPRFLFDLSIPPGEAQTIYARFESESAMNLSLAIWSAEAIAQEDLVLQMINGFIYGVLLIMAAYNFILLFSLRDKSYLYYVLFLTALLLAFLTDDGITHKYIWPDQGRINAIGGQFFFTLLLIFALLFSDSFLQLKEYAPRLRRFLVVITILLWLMLPLQWISLLWTARPILILTIVTFVIVVGSGILVWRKGYYPARYFLLAWLLLLSSFVLFVLSLAGILPLTLFSIAGSQIGIVVLVLTLSLALADRINVYRKEKDEAQLAVLNEKEQALRLKDEHADQLEQLNKNLAMEFDQHTQELSFAQEQLNTLFEGSPLGIGTADLDGNILSANGAMAQMFGYSDEEILSANVSAFFPNREVRQEVNQQLRRMKIVKIPMLQLRRKDGTLFYANLIESILTMADQEVLLGIVDDITEQVLAEQTLQAQAEETAVAAERTRIAGELHDSVTQTLYTTSLIAEALPAVWETYPDEARQSLGELRSLTVGALAEMRTLLLELRPDTLADRTLSELLHQLADAMSTRTEMPITTTVVGQCSAPEDVQMALYRIAQESLNNITKHARASRAWVNLQCVTDGVTLRIGDNGRGFDPLIHRPHELGLDIMHGRAEAIGAEFSITSEKNQGTEIVVEWVNPLEIKGTL